MLQDTPLSVSHVAEYFTVCFTCCKTHALCARHCALSQVAGCFTLSLYKSSCIGFWWWVRYQTWNDKIPHSLLLRACYRFISYHSACFLESFLSRNCPASCRVRKAMEFLVPHRQDFLWEGPLVLVLLIKHVLSIVNCGQIAYTVFGSSGAQKTQRQWNKLHRSGWQPDWTASFSPHFWVFQWMAFDPLHAGQKVLVWAGLTDVLCSGCLQSSRTAHHVRSVWRLSDVVRALSFINWFPTTAYVSQYWNQDKRYIVPGIA